MTAPDTERLDAIRKPLHAIRATLRGMLSDEAVTRTIDLTPEIEQADAAIAALEEVEAELAAARSQVDPCAVAGCTLPSGHHLNHPGCGHPGCSLHTLPKETE